MGDAGVQEEVQHVEKQGRAAEHNQWLNEWLEALPDPRKETEHDQVYAGGEQGEGHAGRVLDGVEEIGPGVAHARADVAKAVKVADDGKGQQKGETQFPGVAESPAWILGQPVAKEQAKDDQFHPGPQGIE